MICPTSLTHFARHVSVTLMQRYPSCWLLPVGCWLLAAGHWMLAAGCWLLPAALPTVICLTSLTHIARHVSMKFMQRYPKSWLLAAASPVTPQRGSNPSTRQRGPSAPPARPRGGPYAPWPGPSEVHNDQARSQRPQCAPARPQHATASPWRSQRDPSRVPTKSRSAPAKSQCAPASPQRAPARPQHALAGPQGVPKKSRAESYGFLDQSRSSTRGASTRSTLGAKTPCFTMHNGGHQARVARIGSF